jgi:hypothetical protein
MQMREQALAGLTVTWLLLSLAAYGQPSSAYGSLARRRAVWTQVEKDMLIALHQVGSTTDEISAALGRPRGSVATKVRELQQVGTLDYRMRPVRRSAPPPR